MMGVGDFARHATIRYTSPGGVNSRNASCSTARWNRDGTTTIVSGRIGISNWSGNCSVCPFNVSYRD